MSTPNDRDAFGTLQEEMTRKWAAGITARYGNPEEYYAKRQAAYLDRWREALRFVPAGSRLLDIGGGNPYSGLWATIQGHRLDYQLLDVSPDSISSWQRMALENGTNPENFRVGFNDRLDYPDCSFDAVFSSHCLEHSIDLDRTFEEIERVLRPSGVLLMAVPLGWEANPAHPYFFDQEEWIALLMGHGFRIRVAQIGCEYPEDGFYDLFIAAEHMGGGTLGPRVDWRKHLKETYTFEPFSSPRFAYSGNWDERDGVIIGKDVSASLTLTVPVDATEALVVCARHAWSGVVNAEWCGRTTSFDLFDWRPGLIHPIRIRRGAGPGVSELRLQVDGQNVSSRGSEMVVLGAMF